MRHRKKKFILNRKSAQKRALMRDLITQMIIKEKIVTTHAKARFFRPTLERIITATKADGLPKWRNTATFVYDPSAVRKLINTIAPRYKNRNGGYTRMSKMAPRRGDGAPRVLISFVEHDGK